MGSWDALDALSHEFELCKLDSSSRVVIVIDSLLSPGRVDVIRTAIARTGATALEVHPLNSSTTPDDHSLLTAAAAAADIVITTGSHLTFAAATPNQQVLHLVDIDPQTFAPHANLRNRTRSLHDALQQGTTLSVHDHHGSALSIELAAAQVDSDHGVVGPNQPTASFPAGWAGVTPAANRVSGELVLMPGDANQGAARLISSPVRLHLLDDHICEIKGDSPDADVIRALFEYAQDPAAYGIANVALGLNPGPAPTGVFDDRLLDPHISRLLAGTVTLSFGNNLAADRRCAQTITLALPGRSLSIDGLSVSVDGALQGDFAPDVYEL